MLKSYYLEYKNFSHTILEVDFSGPYFLTPIFFYFITDAYVKQATQEKIVNQNIFHVHHLHVKMVEPVNNQHLFLTNVNVRQVSTLFFLL